MALNGKRKGLKDPDEAKPVSPAEVRHAAGVLRDTMAAMVESEQVAVELARQIALMADNVLPRFGEAVMQEALGIADDIEGPDGYPYAMKLRRATDLIDLIDLASQEQVAA